MHVESLLDLAGFIRAGLRKSDDYLLTAGRRLIEAKKRIESGQEQITWPVFLSEHCKLSRSRAHELICIGNGTITPEDSRERARKGMAIFRAKARDTVRSKTEAAVRNVTDFKESRLARALEAFDALDEDEKKQFFDIRPKPSCEIKRAA